MSNGPKYPSARPGDGKAVLPNGELPKDPTPLEEHTQFSKDLSDFFAECAGEKTYCIVGKVLPEADESGKVPEGGYNQGLGAILAGNREMAQQIAHAMLVHGPGLVVFALTAEECMKRGMAYVLYQSMSRGVVNARKVTAQVLERYLLDGMETGPIPGTETWPTTCVGRYFYPAAPAKKSPAANRGEDGAEGDGDGGNAKQHPAKNPPAAPVGGGPVRRSKSPNPRPSR